MDSVNGKVAVITGGASGIGLALAQVLAREGSKIVIADIEQSALDAAIGDLKGRGADAIALRTDVSKREQIEALANLSYKTFGRVDMLFNNAGVNGATGQSLWDTSEQNYRWTMDVNYFGVLYGIQAFLPRMVAQGGEALITATSSPAGIIFPAQGPSYSASKAALVSLMEILTFQLKDKHPQIRTGLLLPGPHVINTRLLSAARNLQPDYADPAMEGAAKALANVTFKQMMEKVTGHEIQITEPEEFAEETLQSILRGEFYIMPLNDEFRDAIRRRGDNMIERRPPEPLEVV